MNYYNEHDLKAAAWIQELINQKLIPQGHVDTRSITEVTPDDLRPYIQCHFFAGICGWSLALQLAGVPATTRLWTGSCPCQPFSTAGKGLAQQDERHLWPVFFDLIRQCRPEHVFGEQVASAIGHGWLDGVSADLEAEGYACGAAVLGAHSVNSPHQRQRLYWVADSKLQYERPAKSYEARPRYIAGHGEADRLDDTRLPSNERRGELKDAGRSAGEEQGEARQREWSRDADCDSVQDDHRLVLPDSDGCSKGGIATSPAGHRDTAEPASFWDDFNLAHCRDGKTRRVPSSQGIEPVLQRMVDGFPGSLDARRAILDAFLGFPLSEGIRGRVPLLKGYGNAIVPQVAAEFIRAFYETQIQEAQDIDFC